MIIELNEERGEALAEFCSLLLRLELNKDVHWYSRCGFYHLKNYDDIGPWFF
jgi:hypothetical protein